MTHLYKPLPEPNVLDCLGADLDLRAPGEPNMLAKKLANDTALLGAFARAIPFLATGAGGGGGAAGGGGGGGGGGILGVFIVSRYS